MGADDQLSMVGSTANAAPAKPQVPKCCSCGKALPISEQDSDYRGRNQDGAVCGFSCGYRLAMRILVQAPWVLALLTPRLLAPDGIHGERDRRRAQAIHMVPRRVAQPTKEELHREYEILESGWQEIGARVDTLRDLLGIDGERRPTCRDPFCKCELHQRVDDDGIKPKPRKPSLVDALADMRRKLIEAGIEVNAAEIIAELREDASLTPTPGGAG